MESRQVSHVVSGEGGVEWAHSECGDELGLENSHTVPEEGKRTYSGH